MWRIRAEVQGSRCRGVRSRPEGTTLRCDAPAAGGNIRCRTCHLGVVPGPRGHDRREPPARSYLLTKYLRAVQVFRPGRAIHVFLIEILRHDRHHRTPSLFQTLKVLS